MKYAVPEENLKETKKQTVFMKKLLTVLTASFFLASCEKDESGYGNYIIGINNTSGTSYHVGIYIDGEMKGSVVALSGVNGYGSCGDPVLSAQKENVVVATYVPAGKHKVEIRDFGVFGPVKVFSSGEFTMKADGCVTQQADL